MPRPKKLRRAALACGLAVTVVLATIPWWLGAALRPILAHWNVGFERYERLDRGEFRLRHVTFRKAHVELTIDEVRCSLPVEWLAEKWFGPGPLVTAEHWLLRHVDAPTPPPAGRSTVTGMGPLAVLLQQRVAPPLARWLPRAELRDGELRDLGPSMKFPLTRWHDATLQVRRFTIYGQTLNVSLRPLPSGAFTLDAHSTDHVVRLHAEWNQNEITSRGTAWGQPVQVTIDFPSDGWVPTDGSAIAENWRLPAEIAKLGAGYSELDGGGKFTWHGDQLEISAQAKALPAAKAKVPAFEAQAAAHGTRRELTLTTLHVAAPFGRADLSAPVTLALDHPLAAAGAAQLSLDADLAKMPWFEARGKITGQVRVAAGTPAASQVFELECRDLALGPIVFTHAAARGELAWPLLRVEKIELQPDAASTVTAQGAINWQAREFAGVTLQARLDGGAFRAWRPAGMKWESATIDATLEGSLEAPHHHGTIDATGWQWGPLHPLGVTGSWEGTGAGLKNLSGKFAAGRSSVEFTGAVDQRHAEISRLDLVSAGQPVWKLATPARLGWDAPWTLEQLSFSGEASRLRVEARGGDDGFVHVDAGAFDSHWLEDWVTVPGPSWRVSAWNLQARLKDGAVTFTTTGTGEIDIQPRPAGVKWSARGDAHGVELQELTVIESNRVLTEAKGRLPIAARIDPALEFFADDAATLDLTASTTPDSPLWAALASATGLKLVAPSAVLAIKGSLRAPTGRLRAQAATVALTTKVGGYSLPELTELTLDADFDRAGIALQALRTKLDGQAISATGRLPMSGKNWDLLRTNPTALDWSEATGKIEIPDADLAVLSRRVPEFIAPSGRLHAEVSLSPGAKFSGGLRLTGAASRPLPPFGALQEIDADIALDNRTLTLRRVSAKLGGEAVTLDGTVTEAPPHGWKLALGLKGKNLPVVRTPGLLVRTDLDLHADTSADGTTRLTGALTLRDCLVLANLGALLPTGQRGVTRQPPYFAVEAEPFRHWPIGVDVRGPGAVRIRTAVFTGTASARFQLSGTLGEPRAVGELGVDRGQVLFPFATFTVQSGNLRLREADPFHAVVSLTALCQRHDYQLRLEATGELPSPNVALTSTPTLEAEDVLLMVMTGQPPQGQTATTSATASGFGGQRLALLGAYLGRGLFQDLGFGGEDRLEITSGEQISEQGRDTYEFEYKLNDRWSLTGEYDQFDAYNAGVKWRAWVDEGKSHGKKK